MQPLLLCLFAAGNPCSIISQEYVKWIIHRSACRGRRSSSFIWDVGSLSFHGISFWFSSPLAVSFDFFWWFVDFESSSSSLHSITSYPPFFFLWSPVKSLKVILVMHTRGVYLWTLHSLLLHRTTLRFRYNIRREDGRRRIPLVGRLGQFIKSLWYHWVGKSPGNDWSSERVDSQIKGDGDRHVDSGKIDPDSWIAI